MLTYTVADITKQTQPETRNRIALSCQDRTTTVAELNRNADLVATGLQAHYPPRQARVAILDHNSDQFYEIWLGVARAGLVLVPINTRLSAQDISRVLADCQPTILFVGKDFEAMFEDIRGGLDFIEKVIVTGSRYELWRDSQKHIGAGDSVKASDVCLQLYTSGTTGQAKGVQLTHANLLHAPLTSLTEQQGISPCHEIGPDDVILLCLPHAHVAGSMLGIFGLARGARLVIVPHFDPVEIVKLIEREQVTLTIMVPIMIRALTAAMAATNLRCSSLKTVLYGAAPMPTALLKSAMAALPSSGFGQVYGLTETSGPIAYLTPADHQAIARGNDRLALSCGKPTFGVDIRAVDADGKDLPTGEVGEIICKSSQVMAGYWARETDTRDAIRDEWFHTGDMGYLDMDGYLYIHDRKQDMIISGGENIYPAEVENAIYDHPAVESAVVFGIPDPQWGEAVKAVVVRQQDTSVSELELLTFLRGKLAAYKLPKSVDFVDSLPTNATGKILRRAVRDPYWAGQTRAVS